MADSIRTLTEEGISGFRGYIEAVRRGDEVEWPIDLLTDDATSTAFPQAGQIDNRGFGSKYELADYILQRLADLPRGSVDYNQGLWGWLALYYFPHLCPPDDEGKHHPLKEQLYIPPKVDQLLAYRTYYRHLIAGPYRIRQLHGQQSQALLWGPIEKHPDCWSSLRLGRISSPTSSSSRRSYSCIFNAMATALGLRSGVPSRGHDRGTFVG